MSDKEAQEDELLALASIYDANVFSTTVDSDGLLPGGQFAAHLHLPQPFAVILQQAKAAGHDQTNKSVQEAAMEPINIKFLPPVMCFFELPPDYPSKQPPLITLSCSWLTLEQLSKLCRRLDEMWQENEGDVILFTWTSFLKDDLLEFLQIGSPLDLTNTVDIHTKHLQPCQTDSANCAASGAAMSTQRTNQQASGACVADDVTSGRHDSRAIQDMASQSLLLPTILEFDKRQQEKDFLGSAFTCRVCFMEKLGSVCLSFSGCNHVYCKECMRGYFEVQIGDGNVQSLTCPDPECKSVAHPAQVKELVSSELFLRYDRLLLQSTLDEMDDIMYCPRKMCACAVMVDTSYSMGSCPACHYSFCIFCKLTYHGISPCRIKLVDARKLRDEYNGADAKHKAQMDRRYGRRAMQQIIEESYSNEYLEREARKCPHCATWISKIDGCNKMICTKCHSYFCWLCQALLPKQNPYSHFNLQGSNCFNQLFQGVQLDEEEDFLYMQAEDSGDETDEEEFQNFLRLL